MINNKTEFQESQRQGSPTRKLCLSLSCLDGLYTEATHGNDIYYLNGILLQLTMYIAVITYLIQICFKHTKSLGHYYPISWLETENFCIFAFCGNKLLQFSKMNPFFIRNIYSS